MQPTHKITPPSADKDDMTSYYIKKVIHLPCESMIDFKLVRYFNHVGAIVLLREERITAFLRHPGVNLLLVSVLCR
jgi:hypothetical protein